jgi:peptidoglycan/xylan/chitin deacetylase (PgdA/CDA1 family)/glycosyltransferase involved in cell wall biosynthesis
MRILHVLSQVEVTGAETYAVSLANHQMGQGDEVWIVSDTLRTPTQATYLSQPIDNRRYGQRWKNIRFLKDLLRKHRIDVVHAHSRAASWVCYVALLGTKIPLISTIHGRQHLHTSTSLFDIYGDKVIAVCEDLKTHLTEEVKIKPEKITVIPNGFDFDQMKKTLSSKKSLAEKKPQAGGEVKTLSLVGRTTGPKGERTGQIIIRELSALLQAFPQLRLQVIGGPVEKLGKPVLDEIEALNARFGGRVRCLGFVSDLPRYLAESDLIIASGRVAIDALWLEKPLLALGESQYHGLATAENLGALMASNFGDIIPTLPVPEPDYARVGRDIAHFLSQPTPLTSLRSRIEARYAVRKVADAVSEVYRSARFKKWHPRHIPVLMYHKIPDQPIDSRHRIFVPKPVFERHLRFFQKNGFVPITFKQYDSYRNGQLPIEAFPAKPIFLTFDDAYLDNYTNAFPLLKEYHFKATLFSLGDENHCDNFWDVRQGEKSEPLMNTAQKLEMQAYGIEFGAHTLNHPVLTELPEAEARQELEQSKKNLEEQLGTEVIAFAYPYGRLSLQVKQWTADAGYRYAVAVDSGGLHLEDDCLEIFRVYVFPEDEAPQLRKKTASWYRRYFRWKRGK